MKPNFFLLVFTDVSLAAILGCTSMAVQSSNHQGSNQERVSAVGFNPNDCLGQEELSKAVKMLSTETSTEVDRTKQQLLEIASRSQQCKEQVVQVLVRAMDQPSLDFQKDPEIFQLWRSGAEILGELKASEALDLLVSHLNLTGPTFSTSMKHQPALRGVIKMGDVAIPKLDEVLKHNPDPRMRHSAVYAIATIGGLSAVKSLKEAFSTEADNCVRKFIRTSLDSFDERGQIKDRGEWFSGGVCND